MASCKQCIHEKICVIKAFPDAFENTVWSKSPCDHYKEVKLGENITKNHPVDEFICSECGFIARECHRIEIDEEYGDATIFEYEYRFCPRCGADMRGEKDG